MNILLLGSGGGGGNILRSVKALFRRDLMVAQQTDARYAERLKRALVTRFLDTNEFSLSDVPKEERVLIGAQTTRRLGSRHDPDVAREALDESRNDVERLLRKYSTVIVVGTGGKGTGAGTMFPLADMARQQKKLVIPVFVRPSFERHEVDKRRYDHARALADQFDRAGIRLIEILNDLGYVDDDPQPQSVVWERMNLPIARGLRGLLYVLSDLSQVDPSDLSTLFAGRGRLRIGFSEIAPAAREPSDAEVEHAVDLCWNNPYYAFDGPVGTSLICIQGDWSNLVDAKIKSRLARAAMGSVVDSPYNPLYARAFQMPRPWGVTALFAEYTGRHAPLEIDWTLEKRLALASTAASFAGPPLEVAARVEPDLVETANDDESKVASAEEPPEVVSHPVFSSFWEFAVALNHADPTALAVASAAPDLQLTIEAGELKKLLGTFWFRSVFERLSPAWRSHLLNVFVGTQAVPNHVIKIGRHGMRLSDLSFDQLRDVCSKTLVRGPVGVDLQLLVTIGRLWGPDALSRVTFIETVTPTEPSRFATLVQGLLS